VIGGRNNLLDYAPPPPEALPPLPPRLWWSRLILLTIFGGIALLGVALIVKVMLQDWLY
jgi:hypothetical protein